MSTKDSAVTRLIVTALSGPNDPQWTPIDYLSLAKEGYQSSVWVYACVSGISGVMKGIPWALYREGRSGGDGAKAIRAIRTGNELVLRRKYGRVPASYLRGCPEGVRTKKWALKAALDQGDVVEVDQHPLLDVMENPNPDQRGWGAFFEAYVGYWLIAGNSYVEAVADSQGQVRELWPHRPDRIKVIPNAMSRIGGYQYQVSNQKYTFKPDAMLHTKFFHPTDDWYGMSPLEAAARAVDRDNATESWNTALVQNAAVPAGAFTSEAELDAQQKLDLREQIKNKMAGPRNAGRSIILDGGLSWQTMGVSPKDMDWLNSSKWSMKRICAAYGYPMPLLDPEASATYANYAEARMALYQDTALPLMDHAEDDYNSWLVPKFGDNLLLAYDIDGIEALQEDRNETWTRTNDVRLTIDERRVAVGLDPLPDGAGEVLLIPALDVVKPVNEPLYSDADPSDPEGDATGDAAELGDDKQWKSFNVRGERARQRQWKSFDRVRSAWEQNMEAHAADTFRSEGAKLASGIRKAATPADAQAIVQNLSPAPWSSLYQATYTGVMQDFGARTLASLHPTLVGKAQGEPTDWWLMGAKEWMLKVTAEKVQHVLTVTKAVLAAVISDGVSEGEGMDEIADAITATYKQITPARALRIARTEVIAASNAGSRFAAKSTGLKLNKTWLATLDDRTRPDHRDAEGQTQPLDEPYSVGGYPGMFPGDPSLPPGEVINCRCTETYEVAE